MKKSFWKSFIVAAMLLLVPAITKAQDKAPESDKEERSVKVRPFRIGVKIGVPNLIGGNVEYVLPLLGKRIAANADYSRLKVQGVLAEEGAEETTGKDADFSYLDLGLNYYLFRPGKGLYAGISYSSTKIDAKLPFENGTEYINEKHNSFNVKLGAKLGGLFYFRPEVGYSFEPLPETYESQLVYNDGTEETVTNELEADGTPAEIITKGLMFNIGFGFAF